MQEEQRRRPLRRARRGGSGDRGSVPLAPVAPGDSTLRVSSGGQPLLGARLGARRADQVASARPGPALRCSSAASLAGRLQPLQVPGIELAQVAGGAIGAEVLLGAVDHPEELVDDSAGPAASGAGPVSSSKIQGLPSAPRAIITASAPERP